MSRTADFTTVTCPWCQRVLRARKPGTPGFRFGTGMVTAADIGNSVILPPHKDLPNGYGKDCDGARKLITIGKGKVMEIKPGRLIAVRDRYMGRNEDGWLRVEIPVADGLTLRLEPGDILCGLDMAGQVPAAPLPELRGHSEVLLRCQLRAVDDDGTHRVKVPSGATIAVGRGDLVTALDVAKAPLDAPPSWERTRQIMNCQDDLMYAMSRNLPLPTQALQKLPPWRTLFWAELAEKVQDARGDDAENCLEDGHIDALRMECQNAADEMRYPRKWWS